MELKKYLPIGTVVMLNGGKHRLMIIGFCTADFEKKSKLYDYIACFYPEGLITADKFILFNHSDIDKVYHLGLSDDEEKQFKNKLVQVVQNVSDNEGNLKVSNLDLFNGKI